MYQIVKTTDGKNLGHTFDIAPEITLADDYIFEPSGADIKGENIKIYNANYIIEGVWQEG